MSAPDFPTRDKGRLQAAAFYNRVRRSTRYRRAGVSPAAVADLVPPGTGIASPVTVAQGQGTGSVVAEFENLDAVTTGTLLDTGVVSIVLTATTVQLIVGAINETEDHDMLGSGFHVITAAFDPANNAAKLYVNGELKITGSGAFTAWADASTWTYANALTNEGQVRDLEVVPAELPAIFNS